jgi:Planctomycete cytochrome C
MSAALTLRLGLALAAAIAASGCADDTTPGSACLPELERDCNLAYQPTFDAFFENRLGKTCGSAQSGGSCHGANARMGGLDLSTANTAYDHLLGIADEKPRVIPGDPECSLLMQRLEGQGGGVMPPGAPLSAAERCSILRWIDQGAER